MKKVALIILCLGMFLVGLLTSQVFQIEKVNAAKTIEYKVVDAENEIMSMEGLEKILNIYAKQGWKLNPWGPARYLIFER